MTDTVFKAMEDVSVAAESLEFEAAALQTVASLRLSRREAKPINNVLICTGCESLYTMTTQISQEGIIDWVKDKLSALGRKINIAVNKVYAFVTRADEQTKELIRQAENDPNVELPISGKQTALVFAAAAAVVGGIMWYASKGVKSSSEERESVWSKVKAKCAAMKAGFKESRQARRDVKLYKARLADREVRAERLAKKEEALKNSKQTPANKAKLGLINNLKTRQAEGKNIDEAKLKGAQAKTFLSKLRGFFSSIGKAVKNFYNSFRSAEAVAASDAKRAAGGDKDGIWAKIKGVGGSIKNVFKMVWDFFTGLPGRFKGKAKA